MIHTKEDANAIIETARRIIIKSLIHIGLKEAQLRSETKTDKNNYDKPASEDIVHPYS